MFYVDAQDRYEAEEEARYIAAQEAARENEAEGYWAAKEDEAFAAAELIE